MKYNLRFHREAHSMDSVDCRPSHKTHDYNITAQFGKLMGRTFLGSHQTKYYQHLFACVNVRNYFIYGSDLIYNWCIFSQISRLRSPLLLFPLVTRNFSLLHLYTPGHLVCSETYLPLNCLGSLNTLCFIRIS